MKKEKIKLELEKYKKDLEDLNNTLKNIDIANKKIAKIKRAALCKLIAPQILIFGSTLIAGEIGGMGLPFYRDNFKNYVKKTTKYDSCFNDEPEVSYRFKDYNSEFDRNNDSEAFGYLEYQTPLIPKNDIYFQYEYEYKLEGKSSEEIASLIEFAIFNYGQDYEAICSLFKDTLGEPYDTNLAIKTTSNQMESENQGIYTFSNTETDKSIYITEKENYSSNIGHTMSFVVFISLLEYYYIIRKKDSINKLIEELNREELTEEQLNIYIELIKQKIDEYEQKLIRSKKK